MTRSNKPARDDKPRAKGIGAVVEWARDLFQTREFVILAAFFFFILAIFCGLIKLTVIDAADLSSQADSQHLKTAKDIAKRGTIYDRNGEVIASSVESITINVNPNDIDYSASVTDEQKAGMTPAAEAVATKIYEVLGSTYDKSYDDYYEMVTRQGTAYVVIQRRCDKDLADKLKKDLKEATAVLKDLTGVTKTLNDQGMEEEGRECGVVLLPPVEEA